MRAKPQSQDEPTDKTVKTARKLTGGDEEGEQAGENAASDRSTFTCR